MAEISVHFRRPINEPTQSTEQWVDLDGNGKPRLFLDELGRQYWSVSGDSAWVRNMLRLHFIENEVPVERMDQRSLRASGR